MAETETDTGGGAYVAGDASTGGGRFTGRDDTQNRNQSNPRQRSDPQQNVTFQSGDNSARALWNELNRNAAQIIQHSGQISDILDRVRELRFQMDNLPDKVQELIVQMDRQQNKVQVLEQRTMEVVVRPGRPEPEVIIRPQPVQNGAVVLSSRALLVGLGIAAIIIMILGAWVIYRTVQ